ncbi:hypothetical protein BH18ACT1_BH18ACT1_13160 [soil metagenome]
MDPSTGSRLDDELQALPADDGAAPPAAAPEFTMTLRGYDRLQVDDYLERQARYSSDSDARLAAAERTAELLATEAESMRAQVESIEEQDDDGPPRSMRALGDRVGRILQTTWDTAEELREEAVTGASLEAEAIERRAEEREARAAAALDDAHRRAGEVEAEADEVRRLATEEAARVRDEAEADARARGEELVAAAISDAEAVRATAAADAERTVAEAEVRRNELEEVIANLSERRDAAMGELDRVRAALEQVMAGPPPANPSAAPPRVQ